MSSGKSDIFSEWTSLMSIFLYPSNMVVIVENSLVPFRQQTETSPLQLPYFLL